MKKIINLLRKPKKEWDLKRREGSAPQSNFKQIKKPHSTLIYSPHAKRMISKVPDLMKTFNSLFLSLELIPITRKRSQTPKRFSKKVLVLKDGTKIKVSLERI